MFNGIQDKSLCTDDINVKVNYFSGAKVKDIKERLPDLLKDDKNIDFVVLHVGTNDAPQSTSNEIVDGLLQLKSEVKKFNPESEVIISTPTTRTDNGKASYTLHKVNKHLNELNVSIVDNNNIKAGDLGKKGLHLSKTGKGKLAKNVVSRLKQIVNSS